MPTRFIKESCRTSKNLHAVADFSERVFWRLLTTADDYGRCLACPAIVKSHCFPLHDRLTNTRIAQALRDLANHNLVRLYRVEDRDYAEFVTFAKHQGPPRAKQSKYPPASTCMQMLASADIITGPPDTDTDTKANLSSSLQNPNGKERESERKRGKRAICELDKPTEKHFSLGKSLSVEVGPEWGKFKNYCLAHDKRYANFEAAFRNWIANAAELKGDRHALR